MVIVGGTIGYLKKGSKASLVAGLTVGSLLLGSSYLIAKTDRVFEGHALATCTSGVLAFWMNGCCRRELADARSSGFFTRHKDTNSMNWELHLSANKVF